MGCPQNLLNGRGLKVNTAAKALPISAARPDPGRRGYAWAAVLTYSPRPFTIFCGQPIKQPKQMFFIGHETILNVFYSNYLLHFVTCLSKNQCLLYFFPHFGQLNSVVDPAAPPVHTGLAYGFLVI